MFETNTMIVAFVGGNFIALFLILGILKIIAKATKWVWDDSLVTLISGTVQMARGKGTPTPPEEVTYKVGKPPLGVPALKDRGETLE